MTKKKGKKYNIMRKFTIGEIAAADRPAQSPAKMVIMKRNDTVEKVVALTDPMDGHAHIFNLDFGSGDANSGSTSWASGPNESDGHSHDWIRGANGEIIVGAANGHTHRVGFFSKGQWVADVLDETHFTLEQLSASSETPNPADTKEQTMSEKIELDPKIQEQLDTLAKSNARLEKVASLTDAEKAYFKGLSGDEAEAFLSAENRSEIVTKAAEADPVVFTSPEGREVRKSEDPTGVLAEMAKESKKDREQIAKMKADSVEKDLTERAEALEHIPGDLKVRKALLKGIDSIEDPELRKSANAVLLAKNTANGKDFKEIGTTDNVELEHQSDDDALDAMAKTVMKSDSSLTYEQAYTQAVQTKEGQLIYNKRL